MEAVGTEVIAKPVRLGVLRLPMELSRTQSLFQTTRWSIILAAPGDRTAFEGLIGTYWGPIYAYIRRCGHGRDAAAELTQEFVATVVLERDLIGRADPERGRFRTFVKSAVKNFLVDQHRRATTKRRSHPAGLVVGSGLDEVEPSPEDGPDRAFDREWAATLISQALTRLEAECAAGGMKTHWEVFRIVAVDPVLRMTVAPPLSEIATQLGVDSPERVSSMVQTVRRKFRRVLTETARETVAEPGEAEQEVDRLRDFLGG
jgi:RNA polymerase sigma-70 factor (ECF subfamily)